MESTLTDWKCKRHGRSRSVSRWAASTRLAVPHRTRPASTLAAGVIFFGRTQFLSDAHRCGNLSSRLFAPLLYPLLRQSASLFDLLRVEGPQRTVTLFRALVVWTVSTIGQRDSRCYRETLAPRCGVGGGQFRSASPHINIDGQPLAPTERATLLCPAVNDIGK